MPVNPIPEEFSAVTPYLIVDDLRRELEFLENAFGASIHLAVPRPDGQLVHASVTIRDAKLMLGPSMPGHEHRPAMLYHYVGDVDATFKSAIAAGGKERAPVTDTFYGDRAGAVDSPGGITWWIASKREDISADVIRERMKGVAQSQ